MGRNPFKERPDDPEKAPGRRVRLTLEEKARLATFRRWYETKHGVDLIWRRKHGPFAPPAPF